MKTAKQLMLALSLISLVACNQPAQEVPIVKVDEKEWQILEQRSILFAHQSVGDNILKGVSELNPSSKPLFISEPVGFNKDPKSKISHFIDLVNSHHNEVSIAMMKFCYVDFNKNTNVTDVFNHYVEMIDHLKAKYPTITFAHITVPLTVKPGYVFIQRWRYGEPNLVRRQFNDKIKEVFQNDPIFDLAAIEARYAEDYSLSKNLTDDSGHLNEQGRRLIATEFVKFLSTIPIKE